MGPVEYGLWLGSITIGIFMKGVNIIGKGGAIMFGGKGGTFAVAAVVAGELGFPMVEEGRGT